GTTTNCSPLVRGHVNGNPGVLDTCLGVNGEALVAGSICYADLPDTKLGYAGAKTAQVRNAANTAFAGPASGFAANCDTTAIVLPGSTNDDAVGLNTSDDWASNQTSPANRADITNKGKKWPICGMTWDLVFTGLSAGSSSAIAALNDDQRRTLYAYMSYILSSGAQDLLQSAYYVGLSSNIVSSLRLGFQANY